jgi:hypothetical protein
MSETLLERQEFISDLFISEPIGSEGEADGYPTLVEVGVDQGLQHKYWATEEAGRLLVGLESTGVASYGYTVYRDLLREQPMEAVYLDTRSFLRETDLLDVLEETAKTAIAYGNTELVAPIVKGMIDTAQTENFAGDRMRKYMPTVMHSGEIEAIRPYVDFMNVNTVKMLDESKDFLKQMAHSVQALPEKGVHIDDKGLRRIDKQILLEDIGHAWIRKAMPIAEIDWLP